MKENEAHFKQKLRIPSQKLNFLLALRISPYICISIELFKLTQRLRVNVIHLKISRKMCYYRILWVTIRIKYFVLALLMFP